MATPSLDQLDAQLAAVKSQYDYARSAGGIGGANQLNQLGAQYQSLKRQRDMAAAKANPNSPENVANKAKADAEKTRQEMLGLGQSGIDRLKGDSTDAMIRDFLKGQMGSKTLDPSKTPFGGNTPQAAAQGYGAQGYTGQGYGAEGYGSTGYDARGYDPATGAASSWDAASAGPIERIGGSDPWDATTKAAYMSDASDSAVAGESARNQLIRDAILQSGGNASDPSLAGAYAESLSQRNAATQRAGNQLNMRANIENFQARRQADLANQMASNQRDMFNAGNQQQANASNAAMQQQMSMANLGAQNQAGQFNAASQNQAAQYGAGMRNQADQFNAASRNQAAQFGAAAQNQAAQFGAGAQNQAAQFGAGAQNQANMFNAQNQMQGTLADFNAGNQALMYNQQQQSAAANQLGGYNNQRQGMLSTAEQNQIDLLGRQRFDVGQQQQRPQFPTFGQFASMPQRIQSTNTVKPWTLGGGSGAMMGGTWASINPSRPPAQPQVAQPQVAQPQQAPSQLAPTAAPVARPNPRPPTFPTMGQLAEQPKRPGVMQPIFQARDF